jgi:spore germination protein YaaH
MTCNKTLVKRIGPKIVLMIVLLVASSQFKSIGQNTIIDAPRRALMEVNRARQNYDQMGRLFSSLRRPRNPKTDTAAQIIWEKKPYIPNSGMIHDYQHIYTFIHRTQKYSFTRDYDLKSIEWDSVNNLFYKNRGSQDSLNPQFEVIGWHPSWMGDTYKYYNFRLLSMVSFYSFDINPNNGSASNPDDLDWLRKSSLPDSAAKYGAKTLISVTSLEKDNNHIFLSDEYSRNQFMEEITAILNENKNRFSGIDLNVEEIDPADRDLFTQFVKMLYARLSSSGYILVLDVPYFNEGNVIDYAELRDYVTYFNIMGYDFSGMHSAYPGSVSPLHSLTTQPSLETAVNDFLNLGISGQQVILSLPLYGVIWDVTDIQTGTQPEYIESIPYYRVKSQFGSEYNAYFDPFSSSNFYLVPSGDRTIMCWYEGEQSLGLKFEWAKSMNLKGIGLWALGYDQGAPEIWKAVNSSFAMDSLSVIPYSSNLSGPYGIVRDVLRYKKMIGLGFLLFAAFVVLGFVVCLFDWRVRQVLFSEQTFRVVYALVFLVLIVVGIWWIGFPETGLNLVLGLLTGGSTVMLINLGFNSYRQKLK